MKFASLIPGDRHHEFFLENDGTLEAAQRIAGRAEAGRQSFTTAADKRFFSRIWRIRY